MRTTKTVKVLDEILEEFNARINILKDLYLHVPREAKHEINNERAIWITAAKLVEGRRLRELTKETK